MLLLSVEVSDQVLTILGKSLIGTFSNVSMLIYPKPPELTGAPS